MEISPRKPSKRAQEPVDEWLQNEGYFRKHAPRDPTCLFRAVSEQVYLTQHYHIRVRKECVEFMRKMRHLFTECVTIPFDNYLEQMACFTEWGGTNEIQAMSLLYKREFVIFNGQKLTRRTVTNNGFKDTIYLCHTPQKQYESIYTRDFVATAAYCQSMVYQVLYKDVFDMSNIETTVHKMLHDRSATFRHDKFFLKGNLEIREQLATEIYNRVENGNEEVEDSQTATKGVPPFPYRVAKALDPNIYRNTDFDIWHEIRREVKNAGWTKHNSHELQIGGKCLVQMDFDEEEFDKANNNSIYVNHFEKDPNGNDAIANEKRPKEPVVFCGHIQEMSKNQGPVVVFIEELGEKRTVPYNALKPLPLRKNKQNTWVPMYKRNIIIDSNQKWKKTCSTTARKVKESITTGNIISNNTDKNGNNTTNSNDNINNNNVADINKNNYQTNQWHEDSLKVEHQQTFEPCSIDKCSNYSISVNSPEIFPMSPVFDNEQSPVIESPRSENNKDCRKNNSSYGNYNSDNNVINKTPKSGSESNAEFNTHDKSRLQKDAFYPPYSGNSQVVTGNPNSFCIGPDGNSYPLYQVTSTNIGESIPANQMDRMLRSINCSVQKSVDVNGSDLPLSDPFTLRFFYNLGLEYFRVSHNWSYPPNSQPVGFGPWYPGTPSSQEEATNIANGIIQECPIVKDNDNDRKDTVASPMSQEPPSKCINGIKDVLPQKPEPHKPEVGKDPPYPIHDKVKEHAPNNKDAQRTNRNGLAPRFKKNSDNRYRNASQQPQQQQVHNSNQHQHYGANSPKPQDPKRDANPQYSNPMSSHQPHVPAGLPSSYHAPYVQQGVYASVPYYASEAEAFGNPYYASNPGFFPFPCLPHADMAENNNVQPFSPHLCPGVEYGQTYTGLCPPYVCPQPAPYNVPPQNMQEHWYAVAGQPHYMQYAPVLPVATEATCNGVGNAGQNISP